MFPGIEKQMTRLRRESKAKENQKKPPLSSPDVVETADFVFAPFDPNERFVVKHAFTDRACNEYIYAKLAQAMGYHVPKAFLRRTNTGGLLSVRN